MEQIKLTADQLTQRLRAVGAAKYHHKHPFHLLMHEGKLTRFQLQAWALNRFYYQSIIPQKDALILARCEDASFRLAWRKRIVDHDGDGKTPGGIEKWIRLAEATGLQREEIISQKGILPAARFAGMAYLNLVSQRSFLEAVASSLTEMFSSELISLRMGKLKELYPWISGGLKYFEDRLTQAPEDADFALKYVIANANSRAEQEACIAALSSKCDILWAQLDALYYSYVSPGYVPPDAFGSASAN